jgi:cysteine desulfurase/selenocysteine lyase
MSDVAAEKLFDVEAIRRDFPILGRPLAKDYRLVYLDSASTAQKPQAVIDKEVEVYENYYANAYRGVYRFGAQVDEALELTRSKVQTLVNAERSEEIVFTSGSTMSINMVAYGWARTHLKAGDEVLINQMEHHANFVPWQQMAADAGATCRMIPLTDDYQLDMDRLDEVLNERTRIVAVTAMSNVTGTINPIKELARRAHQVGALIVVDGAQSVPHQPTDVRDLDVDFLAFSGHKIYGPSGIGVLYGKHALLEIMEPLLFGGHMIDQVTTDRSTWAPSPAKFEAGTAPIAQCVALSEAIDYVQNVGFAAIHAHESDLTAYAHERLLQVPGMKIYGPAPDRKGAIVSFTIEAAHPEDMAQLLDRRGVFVRHGHHCTMPLHELMGVNATIRASFGLYTSRADIDALADAIQFAREKLRLV